MNGAFELRSETASATLSDEDVRRLASGIAHDFNNLLSVVMGRAELLLLEMPPDGSQREHVEQVIRAGQRAAALSRQLLAFTKPHGERPTSVDLHVVSSSMRGMLQRMLGDDVHVEVRTEGPLPKVRADARRIEQALVNLCVNAREALPSGGRVTIATWVASGSGASGPEAWPPPGRWVVLCVEDTGVGTDDETSSADAAHSRGLGLAIVRRSVTQLGGVVRVRHERGRGSTVEMCFPAIDVSIPHERATSAGESAAILLVEDDDMLRRTLASALRQQGWHVATACTPEEAIPLVADTPPDVIVLDLTGPASGTTGAADRLRSMSPEAVVVLLSSYDASAAQAAEPVGTAFLQKPFMPAQLTATIREMLESR